MEQHGKWTDRPVDRREDDQLGFTHYGNALAKVILEADTPITIGIFGTWGSGKTSLMQMVRQDLQPHAQDVSRAQTVWFDAWKYDKEETLWRVLLLSALEALRVQASATDQQALEDLRASLYRDVDREEAGTVEIDWGQAMKGTLKLGLSLVPLLPALGEFIEQFGAEAKKKPAGMLGAPKDAINNLVDTFKRQRIAVHVDRMQFLDQFQAKFSALLTTVLPGQPPGGVYRRSRPLPAGKGD